MWAMYKVCVGIGKWYFEFSCVAVADGTQVDSNYFLYFEKALWWYGKWEE